MTSRKIVLQLEIADAIFEGREATTGNASAVRRLAFIMMMVMIFVDISV